MATPTSTPHWRRVTAALSSVALIGGCSSAPRSFTPTLQTPPADVAEFHRAHDSCKAQVAAGKRENFETSRGTSAAVGIGAGLAVAATAGGGGASMVAAAATATAAAAALLVVAPLAIFATSRYLRAGKEDEIKQAMGACLAASGHTISDWELVED